MRARLRDRLPVIDWSAVVVVLLAPVVITALCAGLGHVLLASVAVVGVDGPRMRAVASASLKGAATMLRSALLWVWSHRVWSRRWLLLAVSLWALGSVGAVWHIGPVPALLLVLAVWVLPAAVAAVWGTWWPVSFERTCAGPLRRWGWRRWARRHWAEVSRAVGLSAKGDAKRRGWSFGGDDGKLGISQSRPVVSWVDARLRKVSTEGHVLTLTVQARPGGTSDEITAKAQAIAAMADAHSVTATIESPSTAVIRLVMGDVLAGVRPSVVVPNPDGSVTVGRAEDDTQVTVNVFQPWHIAVQGATRSGKSAFCYGLLGAYASHPAVLVCGLDPSGILLGPFMPGRGGAWIATGTDDLQAHAQAITGVVIEMDRRIKYLTQQGLDKLEHFTPAMPVLMVVEEEYPGLLSAARTDDDANGRGPGEKIAPVIERAVGRLTKEGAKVGVVQLTLAQRMSAKAIDTDDRSNYGHRLTLRVDNGDAVTMLHDGVNRAMVEHVRQFPPGMGLIEAPGRPLVRWRSDFTTYSQYLARVQAGIAATDTPMAFRAVPAPEPEPADPDATPTRERRSRSRRPRRDADGEAA